MERLTIRNEMGVAVLKTPYMCDRCGENIYRLGDYGNGEPIEKLATYEELSEQVKRIILLCEVGDTVWSITSTANYSLGTYQEIPLIHPQEKKIVSITISRNGILYHVKNRTYSEYDFGKSVFLAKEQAEAALKEIQGGGK